MKNQGCNLSQESLDVYNQCDTYVKGQKFVYPQIKLSRGYSPSQRALLDEQEVQEKVGFGKV